MKIIKIGQINFWPSENDENGIWRVNKLIKYLNKFSNKYKYEYSNCLIDNCDIVLYSLYQDINNLKKCKGNPIFIYWTDELSCLGFNWEEIEINQYDPFIYYKKNNLSIGFYEDSEDNCYFPYAFFDNYENVLKSYNNRDYNIIKDKFCTFCASNGNMYNAQYRNSVVKYISTNYKEITCCGKVMNNTNNIYLPFGDEAIKYHNNYKFNLCFENEYSNNNPKYITEKIMNAFMYNVIPIYWGCENINIIFNKNAFINCNGLSNEEILNKIKEVDNNDDIYNDMIHEYPFNYKSINYEEYFFEKICKFIESKL